MLNCIMFIHILFKNNWRITPSWLALVIKTMSHDMTHISVHFVTDGRHIGQQFELNQWCFYEKKSKPKH